MVTTRVLAGKLTIRQWIPGTYWESTGYSCLAERLLIRLPGRQKSHNILSPARSGITACPRARDQRVNRLEKEQIDRRYEYPGRWE
jgi:hypothetical protein